MLAARSLPGHVLISASNQASNQVDITSQRVVSTIGLGLFAKQVLMESLLSVRDNSTVVKLVLELTEDW